MYKECLSTPFLQQLLGIATTASLQVGLQTLCVLLVTKHYLSATTISLGIGSYVVVMTHLAITAPEQQSVIIMVVGAGRGPLITASLQVGLETLYMLLVEGNVMYSESLSRPFSE